jgi:hypothetical protein
MKVQLLELAVVEEATEPTHHTMVDIGVVLILGLIDEVEVTTKDPGALASLSHLPQLGKKGDLVRLFLRTINARQPPRVPSHWSDPSRDTMIPQVDVAELN